MVLGKVMGVEGLELSISYISKSRYLDLSWVTQFDSNCEDLRVTLSAHTALERQNEAGRVQARGLRLRAGLVQAMGLQDGAGPMQANREGRSRGPEDLHGGLGVGVVGGLEAQLLQP